MNLIVGAIGILAGSTVCVVLLIVMASMPFVAVAAVRVFACRESVPHTYCLRSLVRRKLTAAATFGAMTLVVFTLMAIAMLARGIVQTLTATGNSSHAKVALQRSISEWTSEITPEQLQLLGALPSVKKDGEGRPLISAEMVVLIWAARAGAADPDDGANLSVRGVHPEAFVLHPPEATRGRSFAPGKLEVTVGRALQGRFVGADIGQEMFFAERRWTVVGVRDHGGTAYDSEIWGDIEVMSPVFRRNHATASAALQDASGLEAVNQAFAARPELRTLVAVSEKEYWQTRSGTAVVLVAVLGGVVGFIFSFGVILATANTVYMHARARTRELGTLRALGFKPRAILVALVQEAMMLGFAAGVVGVLLASLLHGSTFRLTSAVALSEVTYRFHLGPELAIVGLVFATGLGYAGGFFPAWRAARMPAVEALRAH